MTVPLLDIRSLSVTYRRRRRSTTVVTNVSLAISAGETVSLVGESGSGKTTVARAILGLAPVSEGEIEFAGQVISTASGAARRQLASGIQAVFQDPYSSLNPSMTIEDIIAEPMVTASKDEKRARVTDLLEAVRLPSSSRHRRPREFSGGQRQRIAIARAISTLPKLIICDEPTSALDVTTQARVLKLLLDIQKATGVAYLFISHDLGVVNAISDRIAVLYRGELVESGDCRTVIKDPQHVYTQRLLRATPVADPRRQRLRHTLSSSETRTTQDSIS